MNGQRDIAHETRLLLAQMRADLVFGELDEAVRDPAVTEERMVRLAGRYMLLLVELKRLHRERGPAGEMAQA